MTSSGDVNGSADNNKSVGDAVTAGTVNACPVSVCVGNKKLSYR